MNLEKLFRILAKGSAIFFVVVFLVFFIGEGIAGEDLPFSLRDKFVFACIPILYTVGTIIFIKKEKIGIYIMISSILAFNLITWIFEGEYFKDFDFAILFIPTVLMFMSKYFKMRKK